MDALLQIITQATPLGVIALLAYIIYLLIKGKGNLRSIAAGQQQIANNHLHDLPEVVELLRAQTQTLIRVETTLKSVSENLIYLRARINGSDR